ncbi:MAG: hypothetical protein JOZ18_19960, partial [Chloroflexi bacterium]|nr:hypothetical protein [Chloroflexota bacterium]
FWLDYPPRSATQLARVLRLVYAKASSAEDWRTPFERDEPAAAIVAYEEQQLAESLAYIRPVFAEANQH